MESITFQTEPLRVEELPNGMIAVVYGGPLTIFVPPAVPAEDLARCLEPIRVAGYLLRHAADHPDGVRTRQYLWLDSARPEPAKLWPASRITAENPPPVPIRLL